MLCVTVYMETTQLSTERLHVQVLLHVIATGNVSLNLSPLGILPTINSMQHSTGTYMYMYITECTASVLLVRASLYCHVTVHVHDFNDPALTSSHNICWSSFLGSLCSLKQ